MKWLRYIAILPVFALIWLHDKITGKKTDWR
jgi:hypothetical protein